MPWIKFLLTLSLFSGYLLLDIGIPVHMGHMAEHGMSMETCPYLPFQQGHGDNTLWSHLITWQSFLLILLPVFFILQWVHSQRERIAPWFFFTQDLLPQFLRDHPPSPPLLTLFSQGILHPKAP